MFPTRSPVRKRRPGKRRGSLKDRAYLAWLHELPCVVCILPWKLWLSGVVYSNVQTSATEAAHVGTRGLGQKCSDRETIPLCGACHRTGRDSQHVLGKKFFQHHGLDKDKIIAELNRLYDEETKGR